MRPHLETSTIGAIMRLIKVGDHLFYGDEITDVDIVKTLHPSVSTENYVPKGHMLSVMGKLMLTGALFIAAAAIAGLAREDFVPSQLHPHLWIVAGFLGILDLLSLAVAIQAFTEFTRGRSLAGDTRYYASLSDNYVYNRLIEKISQRLAAISMTDLPVDVFERYIEFGPKDDTVVGEYFRNTSQLQRLMSANYFVAESTWDYTVWKIIELESTEVAKTIVLEVVGRFVAID